MCCNETVSTSDYSGYLCMYSCVTEVTPKELPVHTWPTAQQLARTSVLLYFQPVNPRHPQTQLPLLIPLNLCALRLWVNHIHFDNLLRDSFMTSKNEFVPPPIHQL